MAALEAALERCEREWAAERVAWEAERRSLLERIRELEPDAEAVARDGATPIVDRVRLEHTRALTSVARGDLTAFRATLHELGAREPSHPLTLELFDRIRCPRCDGAIAAPRDDEPDAREAFWDGECPRCRAAWVVLL